jgi:acetyl esterase/lipase
MLLDLAARSGLAVLNALEPRRRARIRRGIAYGKHPRQALDLYAPKQGEGAPVIVFLYGGGWRSGERGRYAFVGESLAEEGFLAMVPDYRLYPEARFPAFVEDAAAAIAWARKNAGAFGGDPGRLFVMGHSGGALIAALIAVDSRYLAPHGLVSRDLAGMIGLAGPYAFPHEKFPRYRSIFAGAGEVARPARLVRRAPPPMLLMHGTADDTVAIAHTQEMAVAVRRAGGTLELREFEDVGHAGLVLALSHRFRARAPAIDEIVAFTRAVLAAPPPHFA